MNDIHTCKTCASHTDLKPRLFWLYIYVLHASAQSVFLYFVTKELSIFRCSAVFLQLEHGGIVNDTGNAFILKLKED